MYTKKRDARAFKKEVVNLRRRARQAIRKFELRNHIKSSSDDLKGFFIDAAETKRRKNFNFLTTERQKLLHSLGLSYKDEFLNGRFWNEDEKTGNFERFKPKLSADLIFNLGEDVEIKPNGHVVMKFKAADLKEKTITLFKSIDELVAFYRRRNRYENAKSLKREVEIEKNSIDQSKNENVARAFLRFKHLFKKRARVSYKKKGENSQKEYLR